MDKKEFEKFVGKELELFPKEVAELKKKIALAGKNHDTGREKGSLDHFHMVIFTTATEIFENLIFKVENNLKRNKGSADKKITDEKLKHLEYIDKAKKGLLDFVDFFQNKLLEERIFIAIREKNEV
jgi:hypothetical protein